MQSPQLGGNWGAERAWSAQPRALGSEPRAGQQTAPWGVRGWGFFLWFLGGRFLIFPVRTHKTSNLEINIPFYNYLLLFNEVKRWLILQWFFKVAPWSIYKKKQLCFLYFQGLFLIKCSRNNSASSLNKITSLNTSLKKIQESVVCL